MMTMMKMSGLTACPARPMIGTKISPIMNTPYEAITITGMCESTCAVYNAIG